MTYAVSTLAGAQPIANTDTTQKHVLGTVVKANDPTYGEGEFIYLLGVGSTVVGSMVTYNTTTYQTTLTPTTGTTDGAPIAVAMSANVASQYGWYQISGNAVVKKTGVAVAPSTYRPVAVWHCWPVLRYCLGWQGHRRRSYRQSGDCCYHDLHGCCDDQSSEHRNPHLIR